MPPQTPRWEMMIVWYFFLGGIAGGAYFTAAIADTFGSRARPRRRPRRVYLALAALVRRVRRSSSPTSACRSGS